MDRQGATDLFTSARDPATSSYCSWRARQPWSAHSPDMGTCMSSLWTLPILYSRISCQNKDPGVVQHSALLADIPSRARPVEDDCPWRVDMVGRSSVSQDGVSGACPLLCAITVVPGHVQDLAPTLQVTTSLEHSTKTFGLE